MKRQILLSVMFVFFPVFSGLLFAQEQIIEIKFEQPPQSGTDTSATMQGMVKVRDIGEQYSTGGLYLITYTGNFDKLFRKENRKAIDFPMITEPWRFCSAFSAKNDSSVIMGRNWDNQNVGSVIAALYKPAGGFTSISFSRSIDVGFPLNIDLEGMTSGPFGERLLLAPFYAYDGMNDQGVCVAVTGISQVNVKPEKDKELIFIGYLVRKILDRTKSIDEAVFLAEKCIPFDLDKNSLNCHLYIADASGRSVILEYSNDEWRKMYPDKDWQAMTNKVVYGTKDTELKEKCWRYKSILETLERTDGKINWQTGMQILRDVSQNGTTWSVVYSPVSGDIYFSVYQTWDKVYHIQGFGE
jgi:hypothetical protein